ncbi:MAG: adenylate kinase family protein [Candidatus Aenigmarchaeota archaeon]|nr:adenylate kinase family protein [Candidatus Aenigmarchaeota archaeon]
MRGVHVVVMTAATEAATGGFCKGPTKVHILRLQDSGMRIAITGTPGTGKTAVARLLARRLGYRYVDLKLLAEKKGAVCGYDRSRRSKIVDVALLEKVLPPGDLVLDGHFSHELEADGVVVLRTAVEELARRLRARGWPARKVRENLQAEIFNVCGEEAAALHRQVLELDTTRLKSAATAAAAAKWIATLK